MRSPRLATGATAGLLRGMKGPLVEFSERIALRRELWWGLPRWGGRRRFRDAVHRRLRELWAIHSRDDPDEAWRCCPHWQRKLTNKWNSREFATRHGCPPAELYWRGSSSANPPVESLPSHYVVRPVFGSNARGVLVVADGRELIWSRSATRSEVRSLLPRSRILKRGLPILIEQFVRSEDGQYRLPLEYKCHTFGDTVAAVEVIRRDGINRAWHRYYVPTWEPFSDPMHVGMPQEEVIRDPPRCLEQMLGAAAKIGSALGTYARLDFFATDQGCVFNEFTACPFSAHYYTPYGNELFGNLWAEKFPNAV